MTTSSMDRIELRRRVLRLVENGVRDEHALALQSGASLSDVRLTLQTLRQDGLLGGDYGGAEWRATDDQATSLPFFDHLREVLAEGELGEVLEELTAFLWTRDKQLRREAIQHSDNYGQLHQKKRRGTIGREEYDVDRARLVERVAEFIDSVERSIRRKALPTPPVREPVTLRAVPTVELERIVGTNNLKNIAWLRRGLEAAKSVCRVTTRRDVGSGFLIAGGRVLTNHHVIPNAEVASDAYIEFNVEVGLDGNATVPTRFRLDPASVRTDPSLDFCVASVIDETGGPSLAEWGHLTVLPSAPKVGTHVTIIQHPAGGPKQIAVTANQVVSVYDHRLQYSTDTMPGSSGSPVFDDDWNVVAIHHSGGNLVSGPSGATLYANEGILMSYILPWLS
jgi:V8-like Glu-specific endopeptidase